MLFRLKKSSVAFNITVDSLILFILSIVTDSQQRPKADEYVSVLGWIASGLQSLTLSNPHSLPLRFG